MFKGSKTTGLFGRPVSVRILLFVFFIGFVWAGSASAWDEGNYLVTDGVDDYAELSGEDTVDVAVTGEKDFTVEAWIYPTGYGCFLADDAYDVGYALQDGSSCIKFRLWLGDRSVTMYEYEALTDGWHHVVVMFDNTDNRAAIGIDGDLSWWQDNLEDDDGLYNEAWPLSIGSFFASSGFFPGCIDEVRISDVLRYPGDSYPVPAGPFAPDLSTLALWHFDDNPDAATFLDGSGHLNHLTAKNGAATKRALYTAAAPVFTRASFIVYRTPQKIGLSSETPDVEIRYTLDGTEPTDTSTLYTGEIPVSETTTIKARAYKDGWQPSETAAATFVIERVEGTKLYLRDAGLLSESMGTPIPWVTNYLYPDAGSDVMQWETSLTGDITGTFHYNLDVVECESAAELDIECIVEQDGAETTIARDSRLLHPVQGGGYRAYFGAVSGTDSATSEEDRLILRITHAGGKDRVGIALDGDDTETDSHIQVYYGDLTACFTVTPSEGTPDTLFSFDASCVHDPDFPSEQLQVRWDWESDGSYDTAYSTEKTAVHQFEGSGLRSVTLQVQNPEGKTRTKTVKVPVNWVVTGSFSTGGQAPKGLAWDGSHLWVSDLVGGSNVIRRMTVEGDAVDSFSSPCGDPLGMAWDGEHLWVLDAWGPDDIGNRLYQVDGAGTILKTVKLPADYSTGLAWDGAFLWAADGTQGRIGKIDPSTGDVVASFDSPGPDPRGLAWDGRYLWNADWTNREIYQLDTAGTVLRTFSAPGITPMGLAWDGENLWCADLDTYTLYRLTDRIPSVITCGLSDADIVFGEPMTVKGRISPAPGSAGAGVSIELVPPEGDTVFRAALADINGEFSYGLQCEDLSRAGSWTVRASWAGQGPYEGAQSAGAALEVSPAQTRTSLSLTSQAIKSGEKVSIGGKITPYPDCGRSLQGLPVELHLAGPDDVSLTIDVVTDDRWGHFKLSETDAFDLLGDWTATAHFPGTTAYAASASSAAELKVVETAGYAVIVQGRIEGEEGILSHQKTAGFVYDTLIDRGLQEDDIFYLATDKSRPGVDAATGKAGVADTLQSWAAGKMNAAPANLYIVLLDHGFTDAFYIHPETITAQELSGWLDHLRADLSGQAVNQEIVVFLGFCRSGSFIDDLSGENRVVIASAAADESSYKGPLDEEEGVREGEYFVSEFFKEAALGKSVAACFTAATLRTEQFTARGSAELNGPYYDFSRQHPLLEDNGDGKGSNDLADLTGDGAVTKELFIGVSSITGNDPGDVRVVDTAPTRFLEAEQTGAGLWARVDDNQRLMTIWAEVKPPGYDPVDTGGTGQATMDLPRTLFDTYNAGDDRYEWPALSGFDHPGTYQVFYFAKDDATGNVSPLKETRVYKAASDNSPPEAFSLVSPDDGAEVLTRTLLDWTDSADPDGDALTYTVLLSRNDPSFSDPIRIEGLTQSACVLTEQAGIADLSTYHWKVRAVDEYGEMQESDVRVFHTDNTNPVWPCWIRGHVYQAQTGRSIAGAQVSVGSAAFETDSAGFYIGQVAAGVYDLHAAAAGCQSLDLSDVALSSGGIVVKSFALQPAPAGPGDVTGADGITLADAILALQCCSRAAVSSPPDLAGDVDGDRKIGLAEALYVLQDLAGHR